MRHTSGRRGARRRETAARPSGVRAVGLAAATLALLLAAGMVNAQFGAGFIQSQWTTFDDPLGRFSLDVPPGWTYQEGLSGDTVHVFYGTGTYDVFYVEFLAPAGGTLSPAAQAQAFVDTYGGPEGLPGFRVVSGPAPGVLGGKEASFVVSSYLHGSGTPLVEGRAFVSHRDQVFTIAFADELARFEEQVPAFNQVMESLVLYEAPQGSGSGTSFVGRGPAQPVTTGASSGTAGASPGSTAPTLPVVVLPSTQTADTTAGNVYTSPGGYYRFPVPAGWELWEEEFSARGDAISPWNGVHLWTGGPVTRTLFIWDYFDEVQQRGAQVDIVLLVADNVPATVEEALAKVKDNITGSYSAVYTFATQRTRIGGQNGVAAEIALLPGYTEPWTIDTWFKSFVFYAFKQGNSLFLWVIPEEVAGNPAVLEALAGFEWLR